MFNERFHSVFDRTFGSSKPARSNRRLAAVAATAIAASGAFALSPGRASADAMHQSTINQNVCISEVGTPGDCTGFVAKKNLQVQMVCWLGGPKALGQYKWFEVTVMSGNGYGYTGDVPAPAVSNQWMSAPRC